MISGSISRRYARALIELADEAGEVERVLKDLEDFEKKFTEVPMLFMVLTNPSFRSDQRLAILEELVAKTQYHDLTRRFLLLLARKKRVNEFEGIVREYRAFFDELRRLVRVKVSTAAPLSENLKKQLVESIEERTKRKAVVAYEINPDMLGGIVTRVGDLMIDGSIATQLKRIKTSLLQEELN